MALEFYSDILFTALNLMEHFNKASIELVKTNIACYFIHLFLKVVFRFSTLLKTIWHLQIY